MINCIIELENWHSQRGPRWGACYYDLDLWTPKSIGVFLSLSSICVWSMKFVGWGNFELSHYNKVWTDRQTDRRTDRRTDRVITIGLPHLRWRGPNNPKYIVHISARVHYFCDSKVEQIYAYKSIKHKHVIPYVKIKSTWKRATNVCCITARAMQSMTFFSQTSHFPLP